MPMTPGEIFQSIVVGMFALAFTLWARRLDKALDLLEKIQAAQHRTELRHERRLTKLEAAARYCGAFDAAALQDGDDDEEGYNG